MRKMEFTFTIGPEQLKIAGIVIIIALAIGYMVPRIVFFLYARKASESTKAILREIIYALDEFADNMSKPVRRKNAIYRFQSTLQKKGIMLPDFVVGFIIDMEVKHIRYLQKAAVDIDTNLHDDNEPDDEIELK
jgi:hypothetical protein